MSSPPSTRAPGEFMHQWSQGAACAWSSPHCLCWVHSCQLLRICFLPPFSLHLPIFPSRSHNPVFPFSVFFHLPVFPDAYRKGLATYSKEGMTTRARSGLGPELAGAFFFF
jgi:hypothetical protein